MGVCPVVSPLASVFDGSLISSHETCYGFPVAFCGHCGKRFESKELGRPRLYCSDSCRQLAYLRRKDQAMIGTDPEVAQLIAESQALIAESQVMFPGGSPGGDWNPEIDRPLAELAASVPGQKSVTLTAAVHWLRTGENMRIRAQGELEFKAALVLDSVGQLLVPTELAVDIAAVARQSGRIRDLAGIRPVGKSNKLKTALLSAATVGWGRLETGTVATDAATAPAGQDIEVFDVLALAKIGVDELEDNPVAAWAAVSEAIGSAIGDAEDSAFASGSGSGQPAGLALAANVTRVPSGQKITAAASATPVLADILALPWKCPTRYRAGGTWLFSEDAAPKVAALTYANGSGIMPDAGKGLGPLGYPFAVLPGLPSMATAGATDPSVWFVNVAQAYRIADRQVITVQRLTESYADQGLVGMLVKRRVGGQLIRPEAAAILLL